MIDTVSFISASLSLNGDTSRAFDSASFWTETVWSVVDAFVDDASVVVLKSSETSFDFIVSEEFDVSHNRGDFLKALWILNFLMFRCKNSWRWGILDSYNIYNFIKLAFFNTFHSQIHKIWHNIVWNDSKSVKNLKIPNTFCKILLKIFYWHFKNLPTSDFKKNGPMWRISNSNSSANSSCGLMFLEWIMMPCKEYHWCIIIIIHVLVKGKD